MNDILAKIRAADDAEINEIIDAVTRRYQEVYPDWEIAFLALPHNDPEAALQKLAQIAEFIRKHT